MNVSIDDETHRLLKIAAATSKRTIKQIVDQAIREFLKAGKTV